MLKIGAPLARSLAAALALLLAACASDVTPLKPATPEAIEAAADVRAVDAGLKMIARGGSAVDAAIATEAVLGLVEPQSSGIGGGGFLLFYDHERKAIETYDGREEAPQGATPTLFLDENGQPLPFKTAVESGLSTGTPSVVAMLKLAHEKRGRLPWASLFAPAIDYAEKGFRISPRLHMLLEAEAKDGTLRADPFARDYFFAADGSAKPVGTLVKNPAYAATLRAIARSGPKALSEGPIAQAIVDAVRRGPRPGSLTLADLQAYKPRALAPVCGAWRAYKVCSMASPSSGGTTLIEILGLYERARPKSVGASSGEDWRAFLWASRLGYADRDYYLADDRFVPTPGPALFDPRYLDRRAHQIALDAAPVEVSPGDPSIVTGGPSLLGKWGGAPSFNAPGTTHMAILDRYGDVVSMTATVESAFGSKRMAGGFILNNELTDFSFLPTKNGLPVANAVAPGKRPRSSMSPTIILDGDGAFVAAAGAAGGSSIIDYVAKTLIGMFEWDLTPQQAIDLPNVVAASPTVRVELDRFAPSLAQGVAQRGWQLAPMNGEVSGLQAIRRRPDGRLEGGGDKRREGVARTLSDSTRERAPTPG